MFSGKTTELMRRLKRYQIAKHNCLVIKYANDTRYDSERLSTHDHQTLPAVTATKLQDLHHLTGGYSIIGIDEGQFFPDTVEFSESLANMGKVVIVAALDGTFQRVGFGNILQLVPLAESVIKLTAVCMRCYRDASYTKRISQETAVEVIGGSEKYIAVCRECYNKESPMKQQVPTSPLKESNTEATESIRSPAKRKLHLAPGLGTADNKENISSVLPNAQT